MKDRSNNASEQNGTERKGELTLARQLYSTRPANSTSTIGPLQWSWLRRHRINTIEQKNPKTGSYYLVGTIRLLLGLVCSIDWAETDAKCSTSPCFRWKKHLAGFCLQFSPHAHIQYCAAFSHIGSDAHRSLVEIKFDLALSTFLYTVVHNTVARASKIRAKNQKIGKNK